MIVCGGQIEAYRVNSFRPVVSDQRVKMDEVQHPARIKEKTVTINHKPGNDRCRRALTTGTEYRIQLREFA
jgi:hypothetical protein